MEHLTKQQIVLLTLLVSFVTSLSTGIVTVSLMDQAPAGVTRTINQIIEKTVQSAPQTASVGTVSISVDDQIAAATAQVASSTVKIKLANTDAVLGLGVVISKDGTILTDKNIINPNQSYVAVLADGTVVTLATNNSANLNGNPSSFIVLKGTMLASATTTQYIPVTVSGSYSLGQKVFSLQGKADYVLGDGLITQIGNTKIIVSSSTIDVAEKTPGAPLFDIQGRVLGMEVGSEFYPIPTF